MPEKVLKEWEEDPKTTPDGVPIIEGKKVMFFGCKEIIVTFNTIK